MIAIDGQIIGGEQLHPVPVGVAHVKEESIGNAVAAGSALHVGEIAAGRHHIADMNDVEHARRP